ncbi:hypothetical protein GJU39_00790 [Pedobacter petrophilus]|uniref:Lipoprotein n=1 Tax=Pedobacter petrophilus TaxID=1908241 RepID=A0A7K0FSM3_9SPHI|nr:hypothetical protein [Pedobacter petrophilus]MRX74608.1 hypothetical protein [Pedobacter petrophilus]
MKNIIPAFVIFTTFIIACQGNSTKTNTPDSNVAKQEAGIKQCFQYISKKDTASLSLTTNKDKVTGVLTYRIFEKDKNNGTLSGIVKGDTIVADYTFQSEGTTSTREVVWLRKNDQLLEATGDIDEVNGKTKFKNLSALSFGKSIVFNKTACK